MYRAVLYSGTSLRRTVRGVLTKRHQKSKVRTIRLVHIARTSLIFPCAHAPDYISTTPWHPGTMDGRISGTKVTTTRASTAIHTPRPQINSADLSLCIASVCRPLHLGVCASRLTPYLHSRHNANHARYTTTTSRASWPSNHNLHRLRQHRRGGSCH